MFSIEKHYTEAQNINTGEYYWMHSNNYDVNNATFENKYVKVSVTMETIKFNIYKSDCLTTTKD